MLSEIRYSDCIVRIDVFFRLCLLLLNINDCNEECFIYSTNNTINITSQA